MERQNDSLERGTESSAGHIGLHFGIQAKQAESRHVVGLREAASYLTRYVVAQN